MQEFCQQGDDYLVSRRQAAAMLGLQPQTLAKWGLDGRHLCVVHIGRTCRYRLRDVRKLIAQGSDTEVGQAA